ncbi:hypothetical protein SRABI106_04400 [Rahnella aquatilis]|nr:hypothetical protein SRABI106_04400 [Rahnella aquatilis]
MTCKHGSVNDHIASDFFDALFFQNSDHIPNILAFQGRVTRKPSDQISLENSVRNRTRCFECSGETEIRPQLQQRSQRRQNLHSTGRQRHLGTVIIDHRRRGANFLYQHRQIRAIRQIFCVIFDLSRICIQNKRAC